MSKKKSTFSPRLENLETRQLMAADVQFTPATGALVITGSAGADNIGVSLDNVGNAKIYSDFRFVRSIPASQIKSMKVELGAGRDSFVVDGSGQRFLNANAVDINMGTGSGESAIFMGNLVKTLTINARDSFSTNVKIVANVTDRALVDMGNDTGEDSLFVLNSDIAKFDAYLGAGSDYLRLQNTTIRQANLQMGDGDDRVDNWGRTNIVQGSIDGGNGLDSISESLRGKSKRFERFTRG